MKIISHPLAVLARRTQTDTDIRFYLLSDSTGNKLQRPLGV
jgi:hypothetical protein